MDFLRTHQLDFMLFLSGACALLLLLTIMTKGLSVKRKRILALLELGAMLLLIFDRNAYLFRGDPSQTGYWMVRVSNFMVYFFTLYLLHGFNLYLSDLYRNEGKLEKLPKRLLINEYLFLTGTVLLIISQFIGLYYTFDAGNHYQRAAGFPICFVIPMLIMLIQMTVIFQYNTLARSLRYSLILFSVVPFAASIVQIFAYGLSLTNITIVGMVVLLYLFALFNLNETAERAKKLEIEFLKKEQKHMHNMFVHTAEALVTAIDAKDTYTHGHSSRVAEYSRRIAEAAGKSKEECEEIYFAALLHDVGKIGIADNIINKKGRLTDEEFAQIKEHPVMGNQILSTISDAPYLSTGAHYHHERFDGRGYPEKIGSEDIPELARIIAVADAYDAMTSRRSYREPMSQEKVRAEIEKGIGTQFDPRFAKIMLTFIDQDIDYLMRE